MGEEVADPCVAQVDSVAETHSAAEVNIASAEEVPPVPTAVREPVIPDDDGSEIGLLAASFGGMLVLVAIASCVIVLRAKKA